jgi:hypothetical protein
MTTGKNTFATLFAAAGLATVLFTGIVTPSLAAAKHTHHARTYDSRGYDARAAAPRFGRNHRPSGGWFAHGERDDPPGAAFQDFGNDQSMGLVR